MQIHISSADGVPIYIQIVNQVKHLVAAGRLASGYAIRVDVSGDAAAVVDWDGAADIGVCRGAVRSDAAAADIQDRS